MNVHIKNQRRRADSPLGCPHSNTKMGIRFLPPNWATVANIKGSRVDPERLPALICKSPSPHNLISLFPEAGTHISLSQNITAAAVHPRYFNFYFSFNGSFRWWVRGTDSHELETHFFTMTPPNLPLTKRRSSLQM